MTNLEIRNVVMDYVKKYADHQYDRICDNKMPDGTIVRRDDYEILCNNEESANLIADFLDALGFCTNTGWYDPEEDAKEGINDEYTGWWYVVY